MSSLSTTFKELVESSKRVWTGPYYQEQGGHRLMHVMIGLYTAAIPAVAINAGAPAAAVWAGVVAVGTACFLSNARDDQVRHKAITLGG